MATLHLMVGLPCSGKTTKTKILEKEYNAVTLTPDVWQKKLFGNDTMEAEHDARHTIVEGMLWNLAERLLTLGVDVILDFGFWGKEERNDFRERAKNLGANFKIHYMEATNEELFQRLKNRNADLPEGAFGIPEHKMAEYIKLFEPPLKEELITE